MRYEILSADSIRKLEDKVNSNIEKGWQPQGGIAIKKGIKRKNIEGYLITDDNADFYYQAMIKN